ncbi:hypothetical protein [uncultured Mediterranean phage uvMED]|nr:hypothetical protein [uncultured Mediterranean phage uvMED]
MSVLLCSLNWDDVDSISTILKFQNIKKGEGGGFVFPPRPSVMLLARLAVRTVWLLIPIAVAWR